MFGMHRSLPIDAGSSEILVDADELPVHGIVFTD